MAGKTSVYVYQDFLAQVLVYCRFRASATVQIRNPRQRGEREGRNIQYMLMNMLQSAL